MTERSRKIWFWVGLGLAFFLFLFLIRSILLPFVAGILIAYFSTPPPIGWSAKNARG